MGNSTGMYYNDYELIYLIREQSEEALELLIKQYNPLIGKIASCYRLKVAEYEDFFQEGLMGFVKSIYSYNEYSESTFYSYALTCVKNAIITAFRKLHRSTKFEYTMIGDLDCGSFIAEQELYSYMESFHNTINDKMMLEKVMADKKILSDFEKACLKHYLLGHNYNEISLILSMPPKKVDNAINRCKLKLKKIS